MANHRAGKREGARTTAGKRKAVKPSRAARKTAHATESRGTQSAETETHTSDIPVITPAEPVETPHAEPTLVQAVPLEPSAIHQGPVETTLIHSATVDPARVEATYGTDSYEDHSYDTYGGQTYGERSSAWAGQEDPLSDNATYGGTSYSGTTYGDPLSGDTTYGGTSYSGTTYGDPLSDPLGGNTVHIDPAVLSPSVESAATEDVDASTDAGEAVEAVALVDNAAEDSVADTAATETVSGDDTTSKQKATRRGKPAPARRAAAPSRKASSARKAAPRAVPAARTPRKPPAHAAPSAPSLIGVAALVVAATGAVTVGQGVTEVDADELKKVAVQASALTGSSKVETSDALDSRERAVSRDSQREALQDAAEEELQAAAEAQAEQRSAALAQLAASAEKYAEEIRANAWVLPLANYELTAGFGESSSLWSTTHTGLDFAAAYGAPVMSVANGTVTSTGYAGAYGNQIIVTLEDGTEIWYNHLSAYEVSPGETVRGGEVIGYVGSTGNSTGAHLHLEVRPGAGDPVDPYAALVAHGLQP